MPLSRRYSPEHPPADSIPYGYDFSPIIPPGIGIASGSVAIWTNTVAPALAPTDFTIGPVFILGRTIYAMVTGGIEGRDYQVRWQVTDSAGNIWNRTALVLCAQTS